MSSPKGIAVSFNDLYYVCVLKRWQKTQSHTTTDFTAVRMKVAQESGQEEEVYQQLLELNAQP